MKLLMLFLFSLISLNATEKCKSVQVKAPGSCNCESDLLRQTMTCVNLTEPPVIPNYINEAIFSDNNLKKIPSYIFSNATNLKSLYMDSCNIQSIDDNAFQNLTELTEVDVTFNYFPSPETLFNILDTCPQLKRLIAGQAISGVIDTHYLPKHNNLTHLDLSFNIFTGRIDFKNLPQLQVLQLGMVIASPVGLDFHFSGMQYLIEIFLDATGTEWMKCGVFGNLPNLEYLHLRSNFKFDFAAVASRVVCLFKDLSKLKLLTLSNNNFKTLPKIIFQNLTKLQKLDLGSSQIETLPKTVFHTLKNIKNINLYDNKLTFLSPEHFQSLKKLKYINLINNQFQCVCNIRPFVSWLDDNRDHIIYYDSLTCTSPDNMVEISLVKYRLSWISCDNHGWLLAGLSGTLVLTIFLTSVTVYYFRWDIRFWFAVRRTRAQMLKNRINEIEADEETHLIHELDDYHAFVSYCSKDSQWVNQELVVNLEEAKDMQFRLYIDERDFTVGVTVLNNISQRISESKKIIFVVTRSFIESRWCTFEVELAQTKILDENSGMIIIIFLENVPKRDMPKSLCRLCKHVTHITWNDNPRKQELFWKRLKLAMNT